MLKKLISIIGMFGVFSTSAFALTSAPRSEITNILEEETDVALPEEEEPIEDVNPDTSARTLNIGGVHDEIILYGSTFDPYKDVFVYESNFGYHENAFSVSGQVNTSQVGEQEITYNVVTPQNKTLTHKRKVTVLPEGQKYVLRMEKRTLVGSEYVVQDTPVPIGTDKPFYTNETFIKFYVKGIESIEMKFQLIEFDWTGTTPVKPTSPSDNTGGNNFGNSKFLKNEFYNELALFQKPRRDRWVKIYVYDKNQPEVVDIKTFGIAGSVGENANLSQLSQLVDKNNNPTYPSSVYRQSVPVDEAIEMDEAMFHMNNNGFRMGFEAAEDASKDPATGKGWADNELLRLRSETISTLKRSGITFLTYTDAWERASRMKPVIEIIEMHNMYLYIQLYTNSIGTLYPTASEEKASEYVNMVKEKWVDIINYLTYNSTHRIQWKIVRTEIVDRYWSYIQENHRRVVAAVLTALREMEPRRIITIGSPGIGNVERTIITEQIANDNYVGLAFHKGLGKISQIDVKSNYSKQINKWVVNPYWYEIHSRSTLYDQILSSSIYQRTARDKGIPMTMTSHRDTIMSINYASEYYGITMALHYQYSLDDHYLQKSNIYFKYDHDGDGLTNKEEIALGTNPFWFDSDNDGINDKHEIDFEYDPTDASDGNAADEDNDKLPNRIEILFSKKFGWQKAMNLNPRDSSDASGDDDGDLLPNWFEILYDLDIELYYGIINSHNFSTGDPNKVFNMLPAIVHYYLGTNPLVPDTDGDGVSDRDELLKGTDPTNPLKY